MESKKITIKELKSIIKEEVSKLQRRTLLESEKKALMKELGMMGEDVSSGDIQAHNDYPEEVGEENYEYFVSEPKGLILGVSISMFPKFYKTFIEPTGEWKVLTNEEIEEMVDSGYEFMRDRNQIIQEYLASDYQ